MFLRLNLEKVKKLKLVEERVEEVKEDNGLKMFCGWQKMITFGQKETNKT